MRSMAPLHRGSRSFSVLGSDAQDATLPRAEGKAALGHVERSVRTDGHSGREVKSGGDRFRGPAMSHAHDGTGSRSRPSSCRTHLKRVQPASAEGEAEDLLDPGGANLERPAPREFVDVLVASAVGRVEDPEVRDK